MNGLNKIIFGENKNSFLMKETSEKIIKSINNPINFGETIQIKRDFLQEDLERQNIKVRNFIDNENNFQEINNKKMQIISQEAENITFSVIFNNFHRLVSIIENFKFFQKNNDEKKEKSMSKAYKNMCKKIDLEKGTNCSGMGLTLKKNLEKKGIYSYLVRFSAFGYVDDEFMKDGHSGLIIPAKISGEKKFIFLDPGIRIFKPIIFDENTSSSVFCDGKNFSIERYNGENKEFDYNLKSVGKDGNEIFLPFNSHQEWLNPEETLIPQSIRYRTKYKIQKFTKDENLLFIMDLENEIFSLKLEENLIKIDFKDLENKKELFFELFEKMGLEKEKMIEEIYDIINNLDLIKNTLLSPKSQEIIKKRKKI